MNNNSNAKIHYTNDPILSQMISGCITALELYKMQPIYSDGVNQCTPQYPSIRDEIKVGLRVLFKNRGTSITKT